MDLPKILTCPRCGCEITRSETEWQCLGCSKRWPIDSDGVLRMSQDNYSFSADKVATLDLLDELRHLSLEEFLADTERLEKRYKDYVYDYCLNPWRADWMSLGDFSDQIILDLGCGYGSVSIPIASRRPKLVIAIDATLERVKFLSIAAKKKRVNRILPIHGNVLEMPLSPGSIDAILMVGFLEYAGGFYSRRDLPARKGQLRFLKQVRNLICEGGAVWVGIENQLSPIHLFGRTYHGEIPFTPLLFKSMANVIHRMFTKKPYQTLLWTRKGYRRLFHAAGLESIRFYYAFPNYKNPTFIASTDDNNIISHYLTNRVGKTYARRTLLKFVGVLDKLRLAGMFSPSFYITARTAGPIQENAILTYIRDELGIGRKTNIEFILHSGGRAENGFRTFIFYSHGYPFLVAKIPRLNNNSSVQKEFEALKTLRRNLKDDSLISTLEVPKAMAELDGNPVLFKDYKEGMRGDKYLLSGRHIKRSKKFMRAATDWFIQFLMGLKEFHVTTRNEKRRVLSGLMEEENLSQSLQEWVEDDSFFLAPSHGDLVPSNILILNSKVSAVVDFENFTPRGIPIAGFFGLLVSTGTTLFGLNRQMVHKTFFEHNPFSEEVLRCVENFCQSFQYDVRTVLNLMPIYIRRAIYISRKWGMRDFEEFHRFLANELAERQDQVMRFS